MATLVLSAAGGAIGGALAGGSATAALFLTAAGQAIGAGIGARIDGHFTNDVSQQSVGQVESFQLQGVDEGQSIQRVFGGARIAGQLIWRDKFVEHSTVSTTETGGGKQGTTTIETRNYWYSCHLAIALD